MINRYAAGIQIQDNGRIILNAPSVLNFKNADIDVPEIGTADIQTIPADPDDASTTVKGITKLSVAPVLATNPIAVGDNDPRMTDDRTPTHHHTTHEDGGDDEITVSESQIIGLGTVLSDELTGEGFYGDGSDGNVTISVDTTLTRNMFYNNLTIDNGITLYMAGFMPYVKDILTLNGIIDDNGSSGNNGSNGNNGNYPFPYGGEGGAGGSAVTGKGDNYLPRYNSASQGGGGGEGGKGGQGSDDGSVGSNGAALTNVILGLSLPINGSVGGKAGNRSVPGTISDGGIGGTAGTVTNLVATSGGIFNFFSFLSMRVFSSSGVVSPRGLGFNGGAGGGGAGDDTSGYGIGHGGGGGGGSTGQNGGLILIIAKTITGTGTIRSNGGIGGNGGNGGNGFQGYASPQVNSGGSGGGGGAGGNGGNGGVIIIFCKSLSETVVLSYVGGTGGTGGTGGKSYKMLVEMSSGETGSDGISGVAGTYKVLYI